MEESDSTKLSRHEKTWQETRKTSVKFWGEVDRYVPLRCPVCGKFVKAKAIYCPNCFQELKDNCPYCGELARLDRRWCPHCYHLLYEE